MKIRRSPSNFHGLLEDIVFTGESAMKILGLGLFFGFRERFWGKIYGCYLTLRMTLGAISRKESMNFIPARGFGAVTESSI